MDKLIIERKIKTTIGIALLLALAGYAFAQPGEVPSDMVRVEGGAFQMGSNNGDSDEKPVHKVTVKSFNLSKYPVTQKEWYEVIGTTVRQQLEKAGDSNLYGKGDNYPMYYVSWYEAIEYCNRLSEKEKLTPAYTIDKNQKDGNNDNKVDDIKWTVRWNRNANGYRLPTEAEWEYAARGGNGSPGNYTYAGSNNVGDVAWYDENSAVSTQEAGAKKPNGLGLYDMSGNVWEWCWDWYGNYPSGTQIDPHGASSGSFHVLRGGSWGLSALIARSTNRNYGNPNYPLINLGFRLARNGE